VVAIRGVQVKLATVSPITRSNWVPLSTGNWPLIFPDVSRANTVLAKGGKPSITPPAASHWMNRRREQLGKTSDAGSLGFILNFPEEKTRCCIH